MSAKKMKKRPVLLCIVLLLALQLVCYIGLGTQKADFHTDEYYTYQLANSSQGAWWVVPFQEWAHADSLREQMVVSSPDTAFRYSTIMEIQSHDLHPFLYSFLVNTVCSFFPGVFSRWTGLAINFFFAAACTVLVFFCTRHLIQNNLFSFLAASAFSFAFGVVNMVFFIRMYVMVMFWVAALATLHVFYWNKKLDFRFFLILFLCTLGGTFTQYHFLIYLFFLCLFFGISLLVRKCWGAALGYLATEAAAGGCAVILYPPMLQQLFGQNVYSDVGFKESYLSRLQEFLSFWDHELFGGFFIWLLPVFIAVVAVWICKTRKQDGFFTAEDKNLLAKLSLIFFPSVCLALFVAKMAPYVTDRYIAMTFPVVFVAGFTLFYFGARRLLSSRRAAGIMAVVLAVTTAFPYLSGMPPMLYRDQQQLFDTIDSYPVSPAVLIAPEEDYWEIPTSYLQLTRYSRFLWLTAENLEEPTSRQLLPEEDFFLYIYCDSDSDADSEQVLDQLQELYPSFSARKLWRTSYSSTYYLEIENQLSPE